MNKVFLIGNLTRDVEIATTQSGISVAKFSLAVGRRFANEDGTRETDFFNIVAWRELADLCYKFLSKGNKCAVLGELQTRTYDDKDGNKKYITEIVAKEVEFLTPKVDTASSKVDTVSPKVDTTAELEEIDDSDLPF